LTGILLILLALSTGYLAGLVYPVRMPTVRRLTERTPPTAGQRWYVYGLGPVRVKSVTPDRLGGDTRVRFACEDEWFADSTTLDDFLDRATPIREGSGESARLQ
jgi:hypothetical protein